MSVRTRFEPFGYSAAGEERYLVYPRRALRPNHGLTGLIFMHPWNGSAFGMWSSDHQRLMGYELGKHFVVAMSDLGYQDGNGHNTWGNAQGITRVHQERDYLVNVMGCNSRVILVGMSHGGCNAFGYARDYPQNVKAVVGLEPALELSSIRPYDPALAASVDLAHGGFSSAINAANSPALYAGSLSKTIPMAIWWAEDDAIILPSTVATFRANRIETEFFSINGLLAGNNGETVGTSPAVGHADYAVTIAKQSVVRWLLNYALGA